MMRVLQTRELLKQELGDFALLDSYQTDVSWPCVSENKGGHQLPLQETDLAGDLEQLEDPARPMTPGAEDDPDARDTALYRQLFIDLL